MSLRDLFVFVDDLSYSYILTVNKGYKVKIHSINTTFFVTK